MMRGSAIALALVLGASGGVAQEFATLKGHSGWVGAVAFSPDGQRLATASADHTVKVWDAVSRKLLVTLEGHKDIVCSTASSPDGKMLASGDFGHTAIVFSSLQAQPKRR